MRIHRIQAILVTGGAGFIGSNFIRFLLKERPGVRLVNLDALSYAGNLESTDDFTSDPRYTFVRGDICSREVVLRILEDYRIDTIVNFAAESHVDRSILSGAEFVRTNVLGTQSLLEAALHTRTARFVQVSTDEVYGSLGDTGKFTEESPLAPNSPYSASKTGADLLCRAYYHTFGLPVVVTRCSNNYGPYQFPEKLIPLMIIKASKNEQMPVYGDGLNVRDWIHVQDHCAGVLAAAERGVAGQVYNFGGSNECPNIWIVRLILKELGKTESLIQFVKDRPGHDRRYAIDCAKARRELQWAPVVPFERGIRETIQWYLANTSWWRNVMTGEYQQYYERNYADKIRRSEKEGGGLS
jgi:dTDP-glucose 4,6-dehydratase